MCGFQLCPLASTACLVRKFSRWRIPALKEPNLFFSSHSGLSTFIMIRYNSLLNSILYMRTNTLACINPDTTLSVFLIMYQSRYNSLCILKYVSIQIQLALELYTLYTRSNMSDHDKTEFISNWSILCV